MKFGQRLIDNQFPPWKNEYIQYDQLKYFLKSRQFSGWSPDDEVYFTQTLLITEQERVNNFIQLKIKQVGSDARKVYDLLQFIQINDTGFYKILKKHDKWTGIVLLSSLYPDMHLQFQSWIHSLHQISSNHVQKQASFPAKPVTTTKFWIHPDNLTEVQANLMFHLPLTSTDRINTVYFDHPTTFNLYSELLERNEEAEIIRARWYGDTNRDVYFERKIHGESWVHNKGSSTKTRIHVPQHEVANFLSGRSQPRDPIFQSMQQNQLKPTLRCHHHRATYTNTADPTLRISLDTNLTFIKQDSLDNSDFQHLLDRDQVNYFPFAVLEIKTTNNASIPSWLTELVESGHQLVYEVPYFSKYMHGTSLFYRQLLPLLPWWLGEMNIDIRRKSSYATIQSQHSGQCIIIEPPILPDYTSPVHHSREERRIEEEREEEEEKKIFNNSSCTVHDNSHHHQETYTHAYDSFLNSAIVVKMRDMKELYFNDPEGQPRDENYVSMVSWMYAKVTDNQQLLQSETSVKKGKKKVEPKLFFSNERTFISWLQFSALLLSVSLGLINFGDHISRASGGFFIVIAMGLAAYAQLRFQYRAWQIRFRGNSRFDDVYGPAVLCLVLIIALFVNLALRVGQPLPENPSPFGNHPNQTTMIED